VELARVYRDPHRCQTVPVTNCGPLAGNW
jgi:hypothetical protein